LSGGRRTQEKNKFALATDAFDSGWLNFSKISYIVVLYSKLNGELTFENERICLCSADIFNGSWHNVSKISSIVVLYSKLSGELTFVDE